MNNGAFNTFAINGKPLDATVRVIVLAYAYSLATPIGRAIDASRRIFANAYAYANATVVARVFSSTRVDGSSQASAIPIVRAAVRNTTPAYAFGGAEVLARSSTRFFIGSPLVGYASATGLVVDRAMRRLVWQVSAQSQALPIGRAKIRSAVSGTAQAIGYVNPTSSLRLPFDKPAIPENTFLVSAKVGTFYVR